MSTQSDTLLMVEYGQTIEVTTDADGYPAVVLRGSEAWEGEPDQWITASTVFADGEDTVRALAAALMQMADKMAATRKTYAQS